MVDKWQSLPVEDSLFPQQSANGSLFQQKTVCSLSHHRVDKWQSLPVEDSLLPKQLANGSLFPRKDSLSVKHSKRSTNGSFFKQFVCFWDVSFPTESTNGSFPFRKTVIDSPGTSR